MTALLRHFLTLDEGQAHVRVVGRGPAILVLHRVPRDGTEFEPIATAWAQAGFSVLVADLPGYGASTSLAEPVPAQQDYVRWIVALLDALSLDQVLVHGEQVGGNLALALARAVPERVRAVSALGAVCFEDGLRRRYLDHLGTFEPVWSGVHLALLWAFLREEALFAPFFEKSLAHRILTPFPETACLHARAKAFLSPATKGAGWARALAAVLNEPPALDGLSPRTLLTGAEDDREAAAIRAARSGRLAPAPSLAAARAISLQHLSSFSEGLPPFGPLPETDGRTGRLVSRYIGGAGRQIHVRFAEAPGTVPLFVQHDAASSTDTVEPIAAALIGDRTVLAIDLPGSGLSDDTLPPDPVSMALYAEAVELVADDFGFGSIDFYGMWGGGFVGLELSRRRPQRVRRLALSNPFFHEGDERVWFQKNYTPLVRPVWHGGHLTQAWAQLRDQGLFYPWCDRSAGGILRREPYIDPAMVHGRVCSLLRAGPRFRSAYQAHFVYDVRNALRTVGVPTAIGTTQWDPNQLHVEQIGAENPHLATVRLSTDFSRWGLDFLDHLGTAEGPA